MTDIEPIVEKLRVACGRRGVCGIKTFGRTFRIFDDDGSKNLSFEEFSKGMHDYGTDLTPDEVQKLFAHFDKDGSGSLCFNELIESVRPPLSTCRVSLIKQAFEKLDADGSGEVTVADLERYYRVDSHPKYQSGQMTKKQILTEFMNNYQAGDKDEKVTFEEFLNYYTGVSASIDQDAYFDLMMRKNWKL